MHQLKTADITWDENNIPYANKYDDIYYSPSDGLSESRYVFCDALSASNHDEFWQQSQICIGETGFGSGLNFLTTWQKWLAIAPATSRLHFVSVEAHPMTQDDLAKALSRWPELKSQSDALIEAYPVLHPGFHRIYFENGRISLTLLIGDATHMLTELVGSIDGWYLDGFAPSKNPDMWHTGLFKQIARLSDKHTRLATFSAASDVKRGLEAVGFEMKKASGFGKKRECLRGTFIADASHSSLPWFTQPTPLPDVKKVAVIGGGIAGVSCYHALSRAGYNPIIFEKNESVASGGSGNPVGLIQPRLTTSDSLDGQFNATAFLHCARHYDELGKAIGENLWHGTRGGVQLARNDAEDLRYQKLVAEGRLPKNEMRYLSASEMSKIAGVPVKKGGLHYASAGAFRPRQTIQTLSENMDVRLNTTIDHLKKKNDQWQLFDSDGKVVEIVDAVIIANAHDATQLFDIRDVPLTAKRGQTSFLPASDESTAQKCGMSFGNYITPTFTAADGVDYHVVGASYRALEANEQASAQKLSPIDHHENLDNLDDVSDSYEKIAIDNKTQGRAAIRATTIDHLPVVGPIHQGDLSEEYYHDLRHGKPINSYPNAPYHEGIYCITGLGSRGVQTAPLLANALVDMISGTPNLLEKRFLDAIHPIRFQIRKLKRKKGT